MQDLPLDTQLRLVLNEIFDKRRLCAFLFAVVSLGIISLGLVWPKTFESSTTLIMDKSQTVRPLLEGTAVTSSGSTQSDIAKEVIYSNKNLDTVIEWVQLNVKPSGELMDKREIEILKSDLRENIKIDRGGDNLLKINYTNKSAEKAYLVVSIASELFIEETTQNKRADSNEAYRFIDSQVSEYKQKLDDINRRINEFKAENVEMNIDTGLGVSTRINSLNDQIRRTALELKEAHIQKDSLIDQLDVESQKTTAEEVANVKQQRLAVMESQLSTLRLSYTETYPDIVQLKEQIRLMREAIVKEAASAASGVDKDSSSSSTVRSELYQRLQRQIADQELRIKTFEARKLDQERRLDQEIARSSEVNRVVSKLEELSRDREVTKQLYDRLLTRRENARVSLNLEMEKAGALFKIQEPPVVPLVPKGLRFLHFAIASIVLGIGFPIGLIIGWLILDSRIRNEEGLDLGGDIEIFGAIPTFRTPRERTGQKFATAQAVIVVMLSLIAVVSLSLSRYYEII